MSVTVVLGEQRGDEGKGRFVDMLARDHDIVARFNGGDNAGHTIVLPDSRILKLHLVPSGIAYSHTTNIIGNGTLVNPVKLLAEIKSIKKLGIKVEPSNLVVSLAAHIILPQHISADEIREAGKGQQGSTKSGIAQVASDKFLRSGLRCEDLAGDKKQLHKKITEELRNQEPIRTNLGLTKLDKKSIADQYIDAATALEPYLKDSVLFINEKISKNPKVRILAEGAQAFLLDIDHGMYPYTTSSNTTTGGAVTGLGVAPQHIKRVVGVVKAVQSHVGGGKFTTEIFDKKLLENLHGDKGKVDAEFGTTTGRIRRLGHLDLPALKRAQMINGTTEIALTKLDWVGRYGAEVKLCVTYKIDGHVHEIAPANSKSAEPVYESLPTWTEDISSIRQYKDLPKNAQKYIEFIEKKTGLSLKYIGVGPGRDQVIVHDI